MEVARQVASAARLRVEARRPAMPRLANPTNIIAQVVGSGTLTTSRVSESPVTPSHSLVGAAATEPAAERRTGGAVEGALRDAVAHVFAGVDQLKRLAVRTTGGRARRRRSFASGNSVSLPTAGVGLYSLAHCSHARAQCVVH
jgi:hypothetical protein